MLRPDLDSLIDVSALEAKGHLAGPSVTHMLPELRAS